MDSCCLGAVLCTTAAVVHRCPPTRPLVRRDERHHDRLALLARSGARDASSSDRRGRVCVPGACTFDNCERLLCRRSILVTHCRPRACFRGMPKVRSSILRQLQPWSATCCPSPVLLLSAYDIVAITGRPWSKCPVVLGHPSMVVLRHCNRCIHPSNEQLLSSYGRCNQSSDRY